jgi:hypothetical protein
VGPVNGRDLAAAAGMIATLGWLIRPHNNTARMISEMNSGLALAIRAATAGTAGVELVDTRSPADRFGEQAAEAIGEFWTGFGDG